MGLGPSYYPASLLWSPGPRPSPVFRSAICDCLSLKRICLSENSLNGSGAERWPDPVGGAPAGCFNVESISTNNEWSSPDSISHLTGPDFSLEFCKQTKSCTTCIQVTAEKSQQNACFFLVALLYLFFPEHASFLPPTSHPP